MLKKLFNKIIQSLRLCLLNQKAAILTLRMLKTKTGCPDFNRDCDESTKIVDYYHKLPPQCSS